ncbi:adenine-specific methyltransferase [Furfurilactobacillus siliginis]|uniref:Adenine-specific methyltransferase n=1 Tax=Furfurilactobacillus siliginis TaxID=348151 RepID=A0A0R2KW30_9LACO|nr:class I SAM-dependent methyltransferase [Furfurilactobacillus siliginis]KRN93584.1 adenine-specific methyltransferase [Furfurilactobacillus siliginis]GEK29240.1 DNA methyltransferase [Furfurilactobacillus siliginis]
MQQAQLETSYLDAFIEVGDDLIDGGNVRVAEGRPDKAAVEQLTALYQQADLSQLDQETIRQGLQLVLLKDIETDAIDANHQLTPDTIGFLVAYLAKHVLQVKQPAILDLAVGTGNLLTTVMNQISANTKETVIGYGVDNDDSMLAAANVLGTLQKHDLQLFHQDALDPLVMPEVDLVVSDLPVGFYPLDDHAKQFALAAKTGHSYVHHLLLEQAVKQMKPGAWGIFLIPSALFTSTEAQGLVQWIQTNAHLQGLLNLPEALFMNKAAQKGILLLQKKGGQAKQAGQVLLGEFPSFKDPAAMRQFTGQIDDWMLANVSH